jgi:hypothetical protein
MVNLAGSISVIVLIKECPLNSLEVHSAKLGIIVWSRESLAGISTGYGAQFQAVQDFSP